MNKPICITIGKKKPIFTLIGGMHGNEHVGIRVFEKLMNEVSIIHGTFRFVIANPSAISQNIRFLETDLNRSFPGETNGSVEEILAKEILSMTKDSDYLIDLHSCPTPTLSFCITRGETNQHNLALKTGIPRTAIYPLAFQSGGSLIDYVPCGIGIELGSHSEKEAVIRGYKAIAQVLASLGMTNRDREFKMQRQSIYKITGIIERKGDAKLNPGIKNFVMIRKGSEFGIDNGEKLIAEKDFVPILFAVREYNHLIGLRATLVKTI